MSRIPTPNPVNDPPFSNQIFIPRVTPLIRHATASLRGISRTFQGTSDTSTSINKRPLLLSGVKLAIKIDENFDSAVRFLIEQKKPTTSDEVLDLLINTYQQVNAELLPPEAGIWRTWETVYHCSPNSIEEKLEDFCHEYLNKCHDAQLDQVSFAAWIEKILNTEIHPFYDGCGRVSRAMSIAVLASVDCKWPIFESRDEYFELIRAPLEIWSHEYKQRIIAIDECNRENHELFLIRLIDLAHPVELIDLEDECYIRSKDALKDHVRDGEKTALGEPKRSFEHSRAAANILLIECTEELRALPYVVQAALIIMNLWHHIPKNTDHFGSQLLPFPGTDKTWREVASLRINRSDPQKLFNPDSPFHVVDPPYGTLGKIVLALTTPTDAELAAMGILPNTSNYAEEKSRYTIGILREGGAAAIVGKISVRLANYRTMDNFDAERVLRQTTETKKYYLHIFDKFSDVAHGGIFAPLIQKLTALLRIEIANLERRPDVAQLISEFESMFPS